MSWVKGSQTPKALRKDQTERSVVKVRKIIAASNARYVVVHDCSTVALRRGGYRLRFRNVPQSLEVLWFSRSLKSAKLGAECIIVYILYRHIYRYFSFDLFRRFFLFLFGSFARAGQAGNVLAREHLRGIVGGVVPRADCDDYVETHQEHSFQPVALAITDQIVDQEHRHK